MEIVLGTVITLMLFLTCTSFTYINKVLRGINSEYEVDSNSKIDKKLLLQAKYTCPLTKWAGTQKKELVPSQLVPS
jgi:hypothetical protein